MYLYTDIYIYVWPAGKSVKDTSNLDDNEWGKEGEKKIYTLKNIKSHTWTHGNLVCERVIRLDNQKCFVCISMYMLYICIYVYV